MKLYTSFVAFGYAEFPGLNTDGTCPSSNGCCAGGLVSRVKPNGDLTPINSQMSMCTGQSGSISCVPGTDLTPTGQALKKIASNLGNTGGALHAVVITDGPPTCLIDTSPNAPTDPCEQTVNQMTAMLFPSNTPSISTFVVGVGVDPGDTRSNSCLNAMAQAGGETPFFINANTDTVVETEIEDIVKSTICRIDVNGQNFDSTRMKLEVNGNTVPPDAPGSSGGWTYDPSSKTIFIDGDQCTMFFKSGPSHHVVVTACPDSHTTFPSRP